MDRVVMITFNLKEAYEELKELAKIYNVSVGIKKLIEKEGRLSVFDPYINFKNNKWVIWYSDQEHKYLCLTPYEIWCQNYLIRKKGN